MVINRSISFIQIYAAINICKKHNFVESCSYYIFFSFIIYESLVYLYEKNKVNTNNTIEKTSLLKKIRNGSILIILLGWDTFWVVRYIREGGGRFFGFSPSKVKILFLVSIILSSFIVILGVKGIFRLIK